MNAQEQQRHIEAGFRESAQLKEQMATQSSGDVLAAAEMVAGCLASGGKILLCGNGGSAADCQHLAAELVGRLGPGRERRPMAAIALTTDTSCLTALGNDYGFEQIFSRQVEALGSPDDILIAISTSGNSPNLILAAQQARERGMKSLAFLGGSGGRLKELVDLAVVVPSENTQRIQEGHTTISHVLCDVVEQMILPSLELRETK